MLWVRIKSSRESCKAIKWRGFLPEDMTLLCQVTITIVETIIAEFRHESSSSQMLFCSLMSSSRPERADFPENAEKCSQIESFNTFSLRLSLIRWKWSFRSLSFIPSFIPDHCMGLFSELTMENFANNDVGKRTTQNRRIENAVWVGDVSKVGVSMIVWGLSCEISPNIFSIVAFDFAPSDDECMWKLSVCRTSEETKWVRVKNCWDEHANHSLMCRQRHNASFR